MGYFSLMKTPGKEFGWKQAEHWITTCCEMGYATDLVSCFFFLNCFVPEPSIEAHRIMLQRKGESQQFILIQGHLINSFDVMYFVRAVLVIIDNTSSPKS